MEALVIEDDDEKSKDEEKQPLITGDLCSLCKLIIGTKDKTYSINCPNITKLQCSKVFNFHYSCLSDLSSGIINSMTMIDNDRLLPEEEGKFIISLSCECSQVLELWEIKKRKKSFQCWSCFSLDTAKPEDPIFRIIPSAKEIEIKPKPSYPGKTEEQIQSNEK